MEADMLGPLAIVNLEGKNADLESKKKWKMNIDHLNQLIQLLAGFIQSTADEKTLLAAISTSAYPGFYWCPQRASQILRRVGVYCRETWCSGIQRGLTYRNTREKDGSIIQNLQ